MLNVWMTPTPFEASSDLTNAIHNIVLRMEKHLPDYGVKLVERPDNAQVYAAHAGQGENVPIHVAHYHGMYNTAQGSDNYAINARVIRNLKTAKIITAPSNWIADIIRRDMHVNPRIIGWGVDTEEWTPNTHNTELPYVIWNKARVDNVSNPAPMLELAARAKDTLFLTTFGQGTPNVHTIGRQPYETMKQHVRNAAVYLSTNVETFGLGILEAMAAGVPILSFRQGAQADYLTHGVDSFLAEPGDMGGLYEGLQYCFKYRDRLSANAHETAKRFTWDRVAREFAAVYYEVLEPRKGAKVSVMIPCHNYAHYLPEAIESALNQEVNFKYEIIVVCDRCTDNSREIASHYHAKHAQGLYPNISDMHTIEADNGNLSATRNQGISVSTGEYIVCLDADDKLGDNRFLQTLSDTLDTDRTLGIAFTGIRVMDADGNLGHKNAWPNGYDYDQQLQRHNQVPSCCMFRREAWERAGGFKEYFVYVQDAEFWTQVGSLGYGAKFIDTDWFHYRLHSNSQSKVHRTGEIREPDWLEWYPFAQDNQRPFASDGKAPRGSWPVRFYNEPTVSIIIPVGSGHERAIKDALHSVEGQTYRFWEVIVVNDTGSPLDLTGYPFARILDTDGCIGAGGARNAGVALANAPFLVFLDADDMLKPRFLELCLRSYQRTGKYAYTDWITQEKQTNFQNHATSEYSLDAFHQSYSIHPVTTLIPRQWFNDVGGFDEDMPAYEDVDLYLKFLTRGYCGQRVAEPLLIYNVNSGQRRTSGKAWENEFRALMKKRYGAFMESNTMCGCVQPPNGLKRVEPTPENAAEYKEAYGDMVKVQYIADNAPLAPAPLKGPATKVYYGRRAKNDIFMVWAKDVELSTGVFEIVHDYVPEPIPTIIPPEPPALTDVNSPLLLGSADETDASPVISELVDATTNAVVERVVVPRKVERKPVKPARKARK